MASVLKVLVDTKKATRWRANGRLGEADSVYWRTRKNFAELVGAVR